MRGEIRLNFTGCIMRRLGLHRLAPLALTRSIVAVLAMTGLLWPQASNWAHADEIARGELLAKRLCAVCHLNPGQGDKTSPSTVPGFVAVAKRPNQTLQGIIDWLRSIPPMMPDHHLSQDEMEALAFYIMSLSETPPTAPEK